MNNKHLRILATIIAVVGAYAASVAQIPNGYYDSLKGKKGAELKNAVHDIIKDANVLNYGSGSGSTWWGFWLTDRTSDGKFIDRYSPESEWVKSSSQGAVGSGMNIEHSFPKSWWGGSKNQAYCDLYNLMPCESKTNSSKSNYVMGKVSGTPSFDNGATKIGNSDWGCKVWEPADEWKGDFARGYMYMATCYQTLSWTSAGTDILSNGSYPTLKSQASKLYIQWAKADMPNQLEITRNNKVSEIQGNRNPFVDFPNLMDYIWGDSIDYAFDPTKTVCSDNYKGDTPDTPDTPGTGTVAAYDFTQGECGFAIENNDNPLSVEVWQQTSKYGWKATAYVSGTNYAADACLVSPEIDLTGYASAKMALSQAVNYIKTDNISDRLSVEVRCDGNTTVLSGFTWPSGDSWTFTESGDISLDEFAGKKIQVAFRYTSTASIASTWEIKTMTVSGTKATDGIGCPATPAVDDNQPYELYDINGQRASGTKGGIVVIKHGKKSWKIAR